MTRFFSSLFSEIKVNRLTLDGVQFPQLANAEFEWLTRPFLLEEVKKVVLEADGNKSPGPDGFNLIFVQRFWDLLKGDIWGMVEEFYTYSKLPRGFRSFFLALIPKLHCPQGLGDYRPISLMGSLHKIISKLLANRLKQVLSPLIAYNQSVFLSGRQILDRVVIEESLLYQNLELNG